MSVGTLPNSIKQKIKEVVTRRHYVALVIDGIEVGERKAVDIGVGSFGNVEIEHDLLFPCTRDGKAELVFFLSPKGSDRAFCYRYKTVRKDEVVILEPKTGLKQ